MQALLRGKSMIVDREAGPCNQPCAKSVDSLLQSLQFLVSGGGGHILSILGHYLNGRGQHLLGRHNVFRRIP